jgi:hypothetical protein
MGGGGYYEYQTLTGQVAVDQLQISDLKTKLQQLTDTKQKSSDEVAQLTRSLANAQTKTSDLDKQLQAAKAALASAQPPAPTPTTSMAVASSTLNNPTPPAFTTKLGTITAADGKTYADCQLLKVNADSIVISNADGITQLPITELPPPTLKLLGLPSGQVTLTDDQVQSLEQQRQTAAAAGR